MDNTKKLHYSILAGIILVAVIGTIFSGTQTPTGRTTMGVSYDYPYYLESPTYDNRPPIEEHTTSNMPLRPERAPANSYKLEPIDYMRSFFGTTMVFFPEQDPCAHIIQKYINKLDQINTNRIEIFNAGGIDHRFLTMLFEEEDKSMGKLTLVKGFNGKENCRLRYEVSKIVVGISSWLKSMDMIIETEGMLKDTGIYIRRGRVNVPEFDFQCSFGY
ncbi:hypothetical protein KY333_04335 [Candidatus Woesearchaeota archaeon]|nr:hypothetical protein [Candidatus Woesearchaeota archaeon]MBW2994125.1 hypothetical protein [Candidatus Woesearchaeota archaeon]